MRKLGIREVKPYVYIGRKKEIQDSTPGILTPEPAYLTTKL